MPKLTFRYYPHPISPEQAGLEKKIFRYSLFIPLLFLLIMWIIKITESTLNISLANLGMYPRHKQGLPGIILSPLIHGDWQHLIGNSASFLVLATSLFFFYRKLALQIFFLNYLLSGVLLWLGGRQAWHIGASGIIYGLVAFLFLSGIFRKDVRLLTISLIVVFLYGSLFWGLFPINENISWDGHLMGAASGTILALIFHKYGPPRPHYDWEDEKEDEDKEEETKGEEQNSMNNSHDESESSHTNSTI